MNWCSHRLKAFSSVQVYQAVFLEATPSTLKMLHIAAPYIVHGAPTLKVNTT